MHQPQIFTTWKITCRSAEDAEALRRWLSVRINLDRVVTDIVRTAPSGREQTQAEHHRLGDYFDAITPLPASTPTSFRLGFQRSSDAGRFWKDLMVNILQEVESAPQRPSLELESKGERQPGAVTSTS